MTKQLLFCFLTFTILTNAYAQTEVSHSYFLNLGIAIPSIRESHYTSNFRNGFGTNVQLGYERNTENTINRFSINFTYSKAGKENISFSNLLRPDIRYEHLRVLNSNGLAIGGYFDVGSLLNFRGGIWSPENGINYTIWSSIGLSTQYNKTIEIGSKQVKWNTRFSLPLISYLIRPSYTFPYTDNYLQNGIFQFDRTGLGESIVKGGKTVSLGKFSNINFQTGLNFPTANKKWELGINYNFNFMQTNELKPVTQFIHQINFTTKYLK